jgi:DNA gyrase subunit A
LNERIAQLVREKKIEGIKDIRDESNREGIRVSIDLRNGVEPETIKRQLYKNTQIESSFGFNTLAIVDGKPKTCNLKEFLENFLTFREDVVIKKTKFDLQKAEERAHILIGLSVSVENLDKVIKIIRNSKTPDDAKKSILNTKWKINKSQKMISLVEGKKSKSDYSLSEPQVVAILELRLQKLTALGINEIEIEIKKLAELITKYKKIISSKKELLKVISEELKNIKEKFAVPRRTKIIDAVLNYDIEETIQKQSVLITVTLQGYIKRGSIDSVKTQKRGGKGKTGITTRNEDSVVQTLSVDTHTSVLFFSTEGLVYRIKAWKIPEGSSSSKGKSLFNILPLKNHQSISSIMPFPEGDENLNDYQIIFATAKGKVRKNSLEDFASINASGKIAMKLDANDKIVGVKICKDNQDAILSTKLGKCIRFETKKLRIFKGRSSKGIKGIELAPNDEIVSLSVINNDKTNKNGKKSKDDKAEIKASEVFILSITENGYGKKTSHYDYRVTNRGGKGIIGIVNSPRNGNISSSFPVYEGDEVMISTNKGRVIRVAVKEIRTAGRNTQGVRIIKLTGDEKVVSAIKIEDNLI